MKCKFCREEINEGATKCIHCSSHQKGWHAFINASSSFLALLVALVSVLSWGIPFAHKSLTPENSNTEIALSSIDKNGIRILAFNKGIRPGVILDVKFCIDNLPVLTSNILSDPQEYNSASGTCSILVQLHKSSDTNIESANSGPLVINPGSTITPNYKQLDTALVLCPPGDVNNPNNPYTSLEYPGWVSILATWSIEQDKGWINPMHGRLSERPKLPLGVEEIMSDGIENAKCTVEITLKPFIGDKHTTTFTTGSEQCNSTNIKEFLSTIY
jgi:hypothetical protein